LNKKYSLISRFKFLANIPLLGKPIKFLWAQFRNLMLTCKSRRTRKKLIELNRQSEGLLKITAGAIIKTLNGNIESEEKTPLKNLAKLREKLSSVNTKITIIDYGAGSSNLNLSEGQMLKGREVSTTVKSICIHASQPYFWSFLLFRLIREFKPSLCLEMGTALGISSSYIGTALKLNKEGRAITMEGSEVLAAYAAKNFQELGLDNIKIVVGRFKDSLIPVLAENKNIDFAFIDGHHDEAATISYFEQILPNLSDRAVMIFDDISWSIPMKRAWNIIANNKKVNISMDLLSKGICIFDKNINEKQSYSLPIYH
jgi:hypothetical protein